MNVGLVASEGFCSDRLPLVRDLDLCPAHRSQHGRVVVDD